MSDPPYDPIEGSDAGAAGDVGFRTALTASSVYFSAQALVLAASLISLPLLTRLLSKSEFGLLSLALATVSILSGLGGLGFGEATLRFYGERRGLGAAERRAVCETMLSGSLLLGIVVGGLTIAAALLLFDGTSDAYARCLVLGGALATVRIVGGVSFQIYRAQERAVAFALNVVVVRYATLATAILLLLAWEPAAFAVLLATLVVELVTLLARLVDLTWTAAIERLRWTGAILASAASYGMPLAIAGAANFFLDYGDRFLIERFLGFDAVATYTVPYDVAERLAECFVLPARLAVVPVLFRVWADRGREETGALASRFMSWMLAIVLPVAALYLLLNREILVLIASQKYAESAALTPYLLPGVLLGSLNFMVIVGLNIQKRSGRLALNVGLIALLNFVLNVLLLPVFGLAGAAIATTVAYLCLVASNYRLSRSAVELQLDRGLVGRALLATMTMALVLLALGTVSSVLVVDIAIRGAVGVAVAAATFWGAGRALGAGAVWPSLPTSPTGEIRVLHAIDSLAVGGTELAAARMIQRMDDRFVHAVCSFRGDGPAPKVFEGVPATFLGKDLGHEWGLVIRFANLCREWRPDVVHARNWATMDAVVGARLAGVPVVIQSEHGRSLDESVASGRRRHFLRRILAPLVDRHVTVAHHLKAWLVEKIGVGDGDVVVVANGVDVDMYRPPSSDDRAASRTSFGFTEEHVVFGAVGRLDPLKGYDALLQAFARLREREPLARLLIVGDGPLREDLAVATERLGLVDEVHWLGHRDDVLWCLAAMDVFVHASFVEGLSNAVLEASACGLPVVASDIPGNREVVVDGRTGLLAAAPDPAALSESLATAMARYAADPDLRRVHGDAGRQRVASDFSIAAMMDGYAAVYEQALLGKRRVSGKQSA